MLQIGVDGFLEKTLHAIVLLSTGLSYGPETLAPRLA